MKAMMAAITLAIFIMCSTAMVTAETIYTWVDKEGIRRFSNERPPEHITDYQQFDAVVSPSSDPTEAYEHRKSYDAMVKDARIESDRLERERARKETIQTAQKQHAVEKALKAKIDAERQRLEQALEKAKNRGLSKTYSQGMRKTKIDKIQKQLDRLNQSPQAYFDEKTDKESND